ncbi:MAG: tetratricopeptide repeat protein [Hyphomicrobium sp.]
MSSPAKLKYRAFLSYSHADTSWAKWLHSRIETFRIDTDLIGRVTALGPVPKTLRPIFRDREDFSGGNTLKDATIAAIDESAALIVLCSTVSGKSLYVNEEIRLFRSRHPDRPVVPVIIEGVPPENFPQALLYELAADGTITDRPVTILGCDVREHADGKSLALAKVIAGVTGVGTDEIVRRAERDQRRRFRNWVAGLSMVALTTTGLAVLAEINRREAVQNFLLAKKAADSLVFDIAQGLRDVEGVKESAIAKILETARGNFERLADAAPTNLDLQRSRSIMLGEFGETYRTLGNLQAAQNSHRASLAIAERLAKAVPGNTEWQRDFGVSLSRNADVLVVQGNLPGALSHYTTSLSVREQLSRSAPANAAWQGDLAASHIKIGDILKEQGNLTGALAAYRTAHEIADRLAKADPGDAKWRRDVSTSHIQVGDALKEQGDLQAAQADFMAALAIRERLAEAEVGNARAQRDLYVVLWRVADIAMSRGELASAHSHFQRGHAIIERLARSDPGNATWQRDLSGLQEKIGDVLKAQGNLAEALAAYRASNAIIDRMAKADPSNTHWQRDLSMSLERIGNILRDQGNLSEAHAAYRADMLITERLANSAPGNANWQRDLGVSHEKLGDVHASQGNFQEAIAAYTTSLGVRERLAKSDPENATWRSDLSTAHIKIGDVHLAQGDLQAGVDRYTQAIHFRPANANAYRARSHVYQIAGQYDLATADAMKAETVEPNSSVNIRYLGIARFNHGMFEAAAVDLLRSIQLEDDAYALLFYHLATSRSPAKADAQTEGYARRLKASQWPVPILDLFLDRRSPEAARDAATNEDERCEADFYIGQWRLLKGDRAAASQLMKSAVAICPKTFFEYAAAVAELKRLEP